MRTNDKNVGATNERMEAKNEGKIPMVRERKRTMWAGARYEKVGASDERVEARNEGEIEW